MLKNLFKNFTVAIYFFFFYVFRNPITWIQNVKKICLRITVVGHYRQVFIYVFRDRLLAYKGSMAFFSQMNSRFDGHLAMLSNARDNIKKTLDLGEVKVSEWWVYVTKGQIPSVTCSIKIRCFVILLYFQGRKVKTLSNYHTPPITSYEYVEFE